MGCSLCDAIGKLKNFKLDNDSNKNMAKAVTITTEKLKLSAIDAGVGAAYGLLDEFVDPQLTEDMQAVKDGALAVIGVVARNVSGFGELFDNVGSNLSAIGTYKLTKNIAKRMNTNSQQYTPRKIIRPLNRNAPTASRSVTTPTQSIPPQAQVTMPTAF